MEKFSLIIFDFTTNAIFLAYAPNNEYIYRMGTNNKRIKNTKIPK